MEPEYSQLRIKSEELKTGNWIVTFTARNDVYIVVFELF